jgi:hypothetical protein
MLYSLLTFFGLQYFFGSYWISIPIAFIVLIIDTFKIVRENCDCDTTNKPQDPM